MEPSNHKAALDNEKRANVEDDEQDIVPNLTTSPSAIPLWAIAHRRPYTGDSEGTRNFLFYINLTVTSIHTPRRSGERSSAVVRTKRIRDCKPQLYLYTFPFNLIRITDCQETTKQSTSYSEGPRYPIPIPEPRQPMGIRSKWVHSNHSPHLKVFSRDGAPCLT